MNEDGKVDATRCGPREWSRPSAIRSRAGPVWAASLTRRSQARPSSWLAHPGNCYFGLDGSEAMTLEEIGALLGITRERVRQIKEKALSRLRHVSRARALESLLG